MELLNELKRFEELNFRGVSVLNNYKSKNKLKTALIQHIINKIIVLADKYLVTIDGQPNYDTIELLNDSGFYIGPGERDRFGWLTGIINTKKGMIVFG